MTRRELPARAANLQRAVASTAACTAGTVESLRTFLLPGVSLTKQSKGASTTTQPSKKTAQSTTKAKAAGPRTKKQALIAVLEISSEGQDGIGPQERFGLATEVVNASLKALTEAIKNSPAQKKGSPLARSSSNTSFYSGLPSRSQSPLQALCINRLSNSPGKPSHFHRSPSTAPSNETLAGLRAQAECARIAFATLRSLQGAKGTPVLPFLQLESGMSAFVAKMLALGFDDLALKELRVLRRRLDSSKEPSSMANGPRKPLTEEDASDAKAETIADMLRYRNTDATGRVLALIVTSQLQVLKILALKKDEVSIKGALQHLQLGVGHSPAVLIQRQVDSALPGVHDKAARQLETLSQLLMAFCPNASFIEDERISKSNSGLTPETAFQIQILSFRIRWLWWRLSGHQSDMTTELINPFYRCLSAFQRRSKLGKLNRYEAAKSAFQSIEASFREVSSFREGRFFAVYQLMADLAQSSEQHSEALQWICKSKNSAVECKASQAQLCALYCRSATLKLRSLQSETDGEVLSTLNDASKCLRGSLEGEVAEIDDLLVSVASLRKSAFSVFQQSRKGPMSNKTHTVSLYAECSNVVLLCPKFIIRYLRSDSGGDENEKAIARRKERRKLAAQITTPTVESITAMARLSCRSSTDIWEKFETGLRDCTELLSKLEDGYTGAGASQSTNKGSSSSLVSISNAYWYRYLFLRQSAVGTKSLGECLRTSIDLIKDRPLCERFGGFLATKLEKYGQLYEDKREYNVAAEAYKEALCTLVGFGLLRTAAEAARSRSIPDVWESDHELEPLSRMLLAYPRTALKAAERGYKRETFFESGDVSAAERGVLLEQQLISVLSTLQDQGSPPVVSQTLNALAQTLLSLYKENEYPVRRLRITVRLLGLFDTLDKDIQGLLLQEYVGSSSALHSDFGLLQYLPHLTASRKAHLSMRQESFHFKEIETVLCSWARLPQEYPDWKSLQARVYDISDWLSQLEIMAEYLEMQGCDLLRISVLHLLVTIHESSLPMNYSILVSKLSELGLQYARLGYSGAAGLVLHKAQRYLEASAVPWEVTLQLHLTYAEYALFNGNMCICKESLERAREVFVGSVSGANSGRARSRDWSKQSQMIADAYYIHSSVALAEGMPSHALFLARLALKNCHRAWAILERNRSRVSRTVHDGIAANEKGSFVEAMSELSISECHSAERQAAPHSSLYSAPFWTLVPRLFRASNHTSLLFAHHGLIPEVRYYLEQSKKVADAVRARPLLGQCNTLLGQHLTLGAEADQGNLLLLQAEKILSDFQPARNYATLQMFLATQYTKRGQVQAGEAAFETAAKTLQDLTTKSFLDSLVHNPPALEDLGLEMNELKIGEDKPVRQPQSKQTRAGAKKITLKSAVQPKSLLSTAGQIPGIEVIALNRIKLELLQGRIVGLIRGRRLDAASSLLEQVEAYYYGQHDTVSQALVASRLHFRQGLEQLGNDPVFRLIPESSISCPSVRAFTEKRRLSTIKKPQISTLAASSKDQPSKGPAKKSRARSPTLLLAKVDFLRSAQDGITSVLSLARKVSPTASFHEITAVLANILIVLSATSSSASTSPVSANLLVYVLEVSRMLSMVREYAAIQVERQMSLIKSTYEWPRENGPEDVKSNEWYESLDFTTFQAEYIKIIPESWTAISLTLGESQEDIYVCKIRAGRSPFVLRIPLNRHSSLDCDEEIFGFEQGKAELQNIILLANQSTNGAQDLSRKGAKTEWWNAREALDARLKDLLTNIENIWFGGFKGIFSQKKQIPDSLSRFQQSLQNILDEYLPSRQKSGRGPQASRVTLDSQVLELFTGLGCPSESDDLDEPLTDLLYFVIDVLQFNGERNAYDEVDFDSIVIRTIDALRQYHQAPRDGEIDDSERHTILILDKNLHCFPWESMPCLDGLAISRLPSLGCLRDRILQLRKQWEKHGILPQAEHSFRVNRLGGASILNPAGDLKATQERLEKPLQELSTWETIVAREPTEAEMKACLEDHNLFLYFGHGSGGNYIRARTIKKLENCAVALLMGCSSGALTEAGDFEPYGTPMNYMHAGCPALAANLWDVTDRDIDRFSQDVLEKWGLFGRAQPLCSPVKKSIKQRGKTKVPEDEEVQTRHRNNSVSLDKAVASARDTCKLRYLNGAAPVVYGVPVSLS